MASKKGGISMNFGQISVLLLLAHRQLLHLLAALPLLLALLLVELALFASGMESLQGVQVSCTWVVDCWCSPLPSLGLLGPSLGLLGSSLGLLGRV